MNLLLPVPTHQTLVPAADQINYMAPQRSDQIKPEFKTSGSAFGCQKELEPRTCCLLSMQSIMALLEFDLTDSNISHSDLSSQPGVEVSCLEQLNMILLGTIVQTPPRTGFASRNSIPERPQRSDKRMASSLITDLEICRCAYPFDMSERQN